MKRKLSFRIWILIGVLAFSMLSIFITPYGIAFFQKGVLVTSVDANGTAFEQGIRKGQLITEIDGQKITNLDDYSKIIREKYYAAGNESIKSVIKTKQSEFILYSNKPPEITVSEIPKTSIKTGLDLSGGARALIQAKDRKLSSSEINDLVDITSNRLNEFGLTDLKVLPVSDLSGNHFMLVEIAGATPSDLREMLSKQGKFEAKIGNETVFIGGRKDIASVSRDAQRAIIEGCYPTDASANTGWFCRFRFTVFLSEDAAKRHANITQNLEINQSNPEYLSEKLDLYLDDKLVDSLFIGKELQGRVTTQISISGSGSGMSKDEAYTNAMESMNKLQTILITGSLPYKLEIVKLDTISPVLGKEFINSIILAGLSAILIVSIIVFLRYKKLKSSLALLLTSISEVFIILGIASFINWNLDLPSIAGILATIGTGIDDLIIILDESRSKGALSMKQRMKRAFAIIIGAYFTAVVALLPLLWAGAGLLKGFAITTLIGISIGILVTRPAFMDMVKMIEE